MNIISIKKHIVYMLSVTLHVHANELLHMVHWITAMSYGKLIFGINANSANPVQQTAYLGFSLRDLSLLRKSVVRLTDCPDMTI